MIAISSSLIVLTISKIIVKSKLSAVKNCSTASSFANPNKLYNSAVQSKPAGTSIVIGNYNLANS